MEGSEKLKAILNKHVETIEKISKEFIEELKKDCKTYGDSYNKLSRLEKEIRYNNEKDKDLIFISYIKEMINKEMTDSLLTNRLNSH